LDARAAAGLALEITRAHPGAVNALEWHPCNEHVLLSAGSDPSIRLWDLRSAAQPLHTLTGHAAPHLATLRAVYRPAFVAAGAAVRA
jgi:WD40 repeat protein